MYLAESRVQFTASLNPDQSPNVTGLESIVSPLAQFANLISLEIDGLLSHSYGGTFFSSAVAMVPRQIWPDKPVGFGAVLGHLFRPELDGSGYSDAALFHGEWIFNFGFVGLVAMVPVVAYLVNWLDRAMISAQSVEVAERRDLLAIAVVTIMGASIVDLLWGGSFTYVERVAPRLLGILLIFLLFAWRRKGTPGTQRGRTAILGGQRHPPVLH